MTVVLSVYL